MNKEEKEILDKYRETITNDVKTQTISLIPPASVLQLIDIDEMGLNYLMVIWSENILRRLVAGQSVEDIKSISQSYIGVPKDIFTVIIDMIGKITVAINNKTNKKEYIEEIIKRLNEQMQNGSEEACIKREFIKAAVLIYREYKIDSFVMPKRKIFGLF